MLHLQLISSILMTTLQKTEEQINHPHWLSSFFRRFVWSTLSPLNSGHLPMISSISSFVIYPDLGSQDIRKFQDISGNTRIWLTCPRPSSKTPPWSSVQPLRRPWLSFTMISAQNIKLILLKLKSSWWYGYTEWVIYSNNFLQDKALDKLLVSFSSILLEFFLQ